MNHERDLEVLADMFDALPDDPEEDWRRKRVETYLTYRGFTTTPTRSVVEFGLARRPQELERASNLASVAFCIVVALTTLSMGACSLVLAPVGLLVVGPILAVFAAILVQSLWLGDDRSPAACEPFHVVVTREGLSVELEGKSKQVIALPFWALMVRDVCWTTPGFGDSHSYAVHLLLQCGGRVVLHNWSDRAPAVEFARDTSRALSLPCSEEFTTVEVSFPCTHPCDPRWETTFVSPGATSGRRRRYREGSEDGRPSRDRTPRPTRREW